MPACSRPHGHTVSPVPRAARQQQPGAVVAQTFQETGMPAPPTDELLPNEGGMALPPVEATGLLPAAEAAPRMTLAAPVVLPALAVLGALLVFCTLQPERAVSLFPGAQGWVVGHFDWFYTVVVTVFLVFWRRSRPAATATSSWARTMPSPSSISSRGRPCCLPPAWASV